MNGMTAIDSTASSALFGCKYERMPNAAATPATNTSATISTVANLCRLISLTMNSALEARVEGELSGAVVTADDGFPTIVDSELHSVLASLLDVDGLSPALACSSRRASYNSIATSLLCGSRSFGHSPGQR